MPDARSPTIDEVLAEFLADQEKRLAPRTFRNYAEVIQLLGKCLNSYGHQSLQGAEQRRWEAEFNRDYAAFTGLFGPDKIGESLGEFLGYFILRTGHVGHLDALELETLAWLPEGALHHFLDPSQHRWKAHDPDEL